MPRKKNTGDAEGQARSRFSMRSTKKQELILRARNRIASVRKNAEYPNRPKIQASSKKLEAAADALEKSENDLAALRTKERALLTTQAIQIAALKRAARSLQTDVDEEADGSADALTAWGFEVVRPAAPLASAPPPPTELRVTFDRDRKQIIRWKAVIGHIGYSLQFGDSVGDKWQTPLHVTRASFYPTGFQLGKEVSVRIAVVRASGMSRYSDAVTFVVR